MIAGLLLGLIPKPAAASGLTETSPAQGQTAIPPSAVFAAFESNLAVQGGLPSAFAPERTALERAISLPERTETYEIAAALAESTRRNGGPLQVSSQLGQVKLRGHLPGEGDCAALIETVSMVAGVRGVALEGG